MGRRAVRRRCAGLAAACAAVLMAGLALAGCTTPEPRASASPPPTPSAPGATPPAHPAPPAPEPTAEPLPSIADPLTTFSFAVIPDTQPEVRADDPRTPKRIDWLVAH